MRKRIICLAFLFLLLFAAFEIAHIYCERAELLSAAITFGTISYHFVMRLAVGFVFNAIMKNKADYTKSWFTVGKWEESLYKALRVKKRKGKMLTFNPTLFDRRIHTWEEIAGAMCQAELVHETIAVLSLVPIAAGKWFGAYPVFIATSIAAALFDLSFAIVQRYNRPRVVKLIGTNDR